MAARPSLGQRDISRKRKLGRPPHHAPLTDPHLQRRRLISRDPASHAAALAAQAAPLVAQHASLARCLRRRGGDERRLRRMTMARLRIC